MAFRDLIEERCGLHFDESQRASLSASLSARMQQLGLAEVGDYYDRLRRHAVPAIDHEFRKLINLVTVTETCFFRDQSQFRLLRDHILPTLLAEREKGIGKTLRIWSAGCSSGEEAYSIALTLWDMGLYLAYPDWTFEIVGTDLNTRVLQNASRGLYSERALRNVEGSWVKRYFQREGSQFRLNDEIRECVQFEFGNLTQTPMPGSGQQDIVFCKNVAIYFRSDATRQLVRGLYDTLSPGGYLVLGHSESLWQMDDGFELVEHHRAYCYRKMVPESLEVSATPPERGRVPFSDNAQYDVCLALFRAADWTTVESALLELIRSSPMFVPAHLLLGGVFVHRARYDEAICQAKAVLRVSDLEPRAHLLLGMIAARQGRIEEAVQSLRRALYLDEALVLAHFWLGNLYRDRGDIARACHEYENIVRHWERHTLDLTEEFASELTPEQLVAFCIDSLQRLRAGPHETSALGIRQPSNA